MENMRKLILIPLLCSLFVAGASAQAKKALEI